MEATRILILTFGALTAVAGLILLGLGRVRGRVIRRIACVGVPLLPVATYTAWLATYPPSHSPKGGFLAPWFLGLIMLSPVLLLWLVACFAAWALGRTLQQE